MVIPTTPVALKPRLLTINLLIPLAERTRTPWPPPLPQSNSSLILNEPHSSFLVLHCHCLPIPSPFRSPAPIPLPPNHFNPPLHFHQTILLHFVPTTSRPLHHPVNRLVISHIYACGEIREVPITNIIVMLSMRIIALCDIYRHCINPVIRQQPQDFFALGQEPW